MSLYCVEWSFLFEREKMKKKSRLKNNQEIGKIVLKKQRVSSPLYNIYFISNQKETKIAVVAWKKCGKANERNYQKRTIREIIRPRFSEINNIHAVVVAKENVREASFIEKQETLNKTISKMIERVSKWEKINLY